MKRFIIILGCVSIVLFSACEARDVNNIFYLDKQSVWIDWFPNGESGMLVLSDKNRTISDTLRYTHLTDERTIGVYFLPSNRIRIFIGDSAYGNEVSYSGDGLFESKISTEMTLVIDHRQSITSDFSGIIDGPFSNKELLFESLLLVDNSQVGYRSNSIGESDAKWVLPKRISTSSNIISRINKSLPATSSRNFQIPGEGYRFKSFRKGGKHMISIADSLGLVRDTISMNQHDGGLVVFMKDSTIIHIYGSYRRTVSFSGSDRILILPDEVYKEQYGMSCSSLYNGKIPPELENDIRFVLFFSSDYPYEVVSRSKSWRREKIRFRY